MDFVSKPKFSETNVLSQTFSLMLSSGVISVSTFRTDSLLRFGGKQPLRFCGGGKELGSKNGELGECNGGASSETEELCLFLIPNEYDDDDDDDDDADDDPVVFDF